MEPERSGPEQPTPEAAPGPYQHSLQLGREEYRLLYEDLERNYRIAGRTMREWAQFFRVTLPPDPTPSELRKILSDLCKFYQIADHFLRQARLAYRAALLNYDLALSEAMGRVKEAWGGSRPPGRETLRELALQECLAQASTLANAQAHQEFWEDVVWQLKNQLEMTAIVQRLQAMEARLEASTGR